MTITGDRLRELRKEKRKTLREVNEDTGISYSGLASIERGENSCNASTLKILSEYYGVSTDYLLGNTSSKIDENDFQFALHGTLQRLSDDDKEMILSLAKKLANKNDTK